MAATVGLLPAKDTNASSRLMTLAGVVVVIVGLYFGRRFLIPLALAVILAFLATPIVSLLERIRLGRVVSVVVVLALFFAVLGTVAWSVSGQLLQTIGQLPDYKENIHQKIQAIRASKNGGLSKATATVNDLSKELSGASTTAAAKKLGRNDPIPVQVASPPRNADEYLRDLIGPLTGVMETTGIVVIFTLFVVVKREDLRNRIIRLAGVRQLTLVTQAMDDASQRLSRYLLFQFIVNATYGGLFGIGLYFIGIPHPLLWGTFAFLLRFVPYLGTPISALFPAVLAFAIFPGWKEVALTFATFLVLELVTANLIEPWLYGAHTGVSSLAIVVAAIFWGALWGPVGLILSTPLTMCLMLLGRYVPHLSFLDVLLGDEPVLAPKEHLYQRLLALDIEEAREVAWNYLKDNSLVNFYDSVLIPALSLAEQDRRINAVDETRLKFIHQSASELIEELYDISQTSSAEADVDSCAVTAVRQQSSTSKVACIPAGDDVDEMAATMLSQVLENDGHSTQVISGSAAQVFEQVDTLHPDAICISALHPFATGQARLLCKRLHQHCPEVKLVIGLWGFAAGAAKAQERIGTTCAEGVGTSLCEVASILGSNAQKEVSVPSSLSVA